MRLIDKDKLIATILKSHLDNGVNDIVPLYRLTNKAILEAPIIEAIPIEWVENWSRQFYKNIKGTVYYMGEGYDSVWSVIDEWRKANEQVNSNN